MPEKRQSALQHRAYHCRVEAIGKDEYALRISGSGTVNGTSYEAVGEGRADPSSGEISFAVDFSAAPEGVDLFANLLAVIIIPRERRRHRDQRAGCDQTKRRGKPTSYVCIHGHLTCN